MKKYLAMFLAFALVLLPGTTFAQIPSNLATVNLTMSIGETFTLSASPASVSFNYSNGTATASGPITVSSSWALAPAPSHGVAIDAWFATPSAALSGAANILSSSVLASIDGAAAAACNLTDANPNMSFATAGGTCPRVLSNGNEPAVGNGSDTILLQLTGLSGAPGTYTGTLNIQGFAQ